MTGGPRTTPTDSLLPTAETMQRPCFVVPDAHGNAPLVLGLLAQEGILERRNGGEQQGWYHTRIDYETHVVQLGDLANCVAASTRDDLDALDLVRCGIIDVMLVGNHEHPYFGGPAFGGYWPDGEVRRRLYDIRDRGGLKAAHAVGDILVSHAGLTSHWLREFGGWHWSAEKIAECTNLTWRNDPRALIFSVIGQSRGGWEREGGMLWSDWREPKPRHLRQLVGHTVGNCVRKRSGSTCIDLGAGKGSTRIAGAWIRGGVIDVVVHEMQPAELAS